MMAEGYRERLQKSLEWFQSYFKKFSSSAYGELKAAGHKISSESAMQALARAARAARHAALDDPAHAIIRELIRYPPEV
jgi:hypothetical protein